jgi:hypothetical protein
MGDSVKAVNNFTQFAIISLLSHALISQKSLESRSFNPGNNSNESETMCREQD